MWRNEQGELSFYSLLERAERRRQWTVVMGLQATIGMGEGVVLFSRSR